ncbi:hypothetical protein [Serratia marcescens]|uniref:hypothetical protein n=1 Tax=Serratia marcescens TaxID=615 RepID=UPI0027E4B886|nr:hypothetical protein [Serratia marcescens]
MNIAVTNFKHMLIELDGKPCALFNAVAFNTNTLNVIRDSQALNLPARHHTAALSVELLSAIQSDQFGNVGISHQPAIKHHEVMCRMVLRDASPLG